MTLAFVDIAVFMMNFVLALLIAFGCAGVFS